MIAMVVLTVVQRSAYSRTLLLLGVGLVSMAVADSGFAYLTATGHYQTGDPIDAGWIAAFLLIMIAAATAPRGRPVTPCVVERRPARARRSCPTCRSSSRPRRSVSRAPAVRRPTRPSWSSRPSPSCLLLLRQYATVVENRRLVVQVAAREKQLQEQAFHDQLTGLANRRLFADRVKHALDLHAVDERSFAVLFCDLDDFKGVNDTLGHAAGDTCWCRSPSGCGSVLRASDTLARLGGDEFAVLVEDGEDPAAVGRRLVDALREPFFVDDMRLDARISVGVTIVHPGSPPPSLRTLLSQADVAMYAAKRAGKGKVERYRSGMTLPETEDLMLSEPLRQRSRRRRRARVLPADHGPRQRRRPRLRGPGPLELPGQARAAATDGRGRRAVRPGPRADRQHARAGLRAAGRLERRPRPRLAAGRGQHPAAPGRRPRAARASSRMPLRDMTFRPTS